MTDKLVTGIFPMSAAEYHADPCDVPSLSSSIAKIIIADSAAHAYLRHPKLGAKRGKATAAMNAGSIQHALLLGKGSEQIVVVDADDYRTKEAQRVRDAAEAAGFTPIIASKYAEHERVAKILDRKLRMPRKSRPQGYALSGPGGESEQVFMWVELATDGTPVQCRCMMDRVITVEDHILDLKMSVNVVPEDIVKTVEKLHYNISEAAYTDAYGCVYPDARGRIKFTRLFAEIEEPHCIAPDVSDGSMRQLGLFLWQRAIDVWAKCLATDVWPEPVPDVHVSSATKWALEAAGFDLFQEAAE